MKLGELSGLVEAAKQLGLKKPKVKKEAEEPQIQVHEALTDQDEMLLQKHGYIIR